MAIWCMEWWCYISKSSWSWWNAGVKWINNNMVAALRFSRLRVYFSLLLVKGVPSFPGYCVICVTSVMLKQLFFAQARKPAWNNHGLSTSQVILQLSFYRRIHISKETYFQLKSGKFEVEPGEGHTRDSYLADHKIETFLIISPKVTILLFALFLLIERDMNNIVGWLRMSSFLRFGP